MIELNLQYLHQINKNEWAAECPHCGGVPHRNGELPDRFRVWYKSNATGGMLGWCRHCGYKWIPNKELTYKQNDNWIKEREKIEWDNIKKAENALKLLQDEKAWLRYNRNLDDAKREHYYKRGITDYWIDYWMLGYNDNKLVWENGESYSTQALTIPIFDPISGDVLNIRNRLLNPRKQNDKYRPERAGLPASLYFTDKEKIGDKILIVEGEFKAMTTYITIDDPELFVVGLPGKSPNMDILSPLANCEIAYVLLDPDADPTKIVKHFGKKGRFIKLPHKVDDMITDGWLGKRELGRIIEYAWKWNRL